MGARKENKQNNTRGSSSSSSSSSSSNSSGSDAPAPTPARPVIPRVLRELQETAPHYYQTLQQYRGDHKRYELEAFWMELRAPNVVHEFLDRSCFAQPE